eukprot:CAMPEP_0194207846 /NCGR_PEP_ID=MMETSP0156-20130528/6475_1 /TAXON_ID=33649 /ORGANISM="Thalassionema nitzschioides, Strain L26-B" /LENGTH=183 /DNA_ID=CAMNT_0038934707 /DNA_START=176 /DNA_END=727 /DNA_ORIENTATION=-
MAELVLVITHALDPMDHESSNPVMEAVADVCIRASKTRDTSIKVRRSLYLYMAGSKQMLGSRGFDKDEWDKQWTAGEKFFALMIKRIGLEKFGTAGYRGAQFTAQLLDVEAAIDRVGVRCASHLRLRRVPPIKNVTVIVPSSFTEDKSICSSIEDASKILMNCWQGYDILKEAEITFMVAKVC